MPRASAYGMMLNAWSNRPQDITWYEDHAEYNGEIKYYKDIKKCGWYQERNRTIAMLPADQYQYTVYIDEWVLRRSHTCSLRVSSKAKSITNEIASEYENIINEIIQNILPHIFGRYANRIMNGETIKPSGLMIGNESITINRTTLTVHGRRRNDIRSYDIGSISAQINNGYVYIYKAGLNDSIYKGSVANTDALILEPIINFVKSTLR